MNNEEILTKMHSLHLILADELKRICERHQITYFMIAGTLLGAIRHHGFIPWDDDMDFGMRREDFDRFIKIAPYEINSDKFVLQTDENDELYTFNFAKLRLKGTRIEEIWSARVNAINGIYIDIFPIDAVSDNKILAFIQYKSFWLFRNLLWIKCGYGSDEQKKKPSYKIGSMISHFFTIKQLKYIKNKVITRYAGKETKTVVTSDGNYGLQKETLDSNFVNKTKDYQFEDRIYPGIADYEGYLSYFYGNYMELPPVEKRNHHGRIMVDFGAYETEN